MIWKEGRGDRELYRDKQSYRLIERKAKSTKLLYHRNTDKKIKRFMKRVGERKTEKILYKTGDI